MEVSRRHFGGLRLHDLRHSYATWLVDDGVPPNMVQRVIGHERASTTLDLYTRRTANTDRVLAALSDDDEHADHEDEGANSCLPLLLGRCLDLARRRENPWPVTLASR
jgi:hypothetical protein